MYKDKDKQREADKARQRRYRESHPITGKRRDKDVTESGCDTKGVTGSCCIDHEHNFTGEQPKRGKDIKCFEDLPPDVQQTIDQMSVVDGRIDQTIKAKRTLAAIKYQHLFPESYEPGHITDISKMVTGKPGDADYNGVCTEEWRQARGR